MNALQAIVTTLLLLSREIHRPLLKITVSRRFLQQVPSGSDETQLAYTFRSS